MKQPARGFTLLEVMVSVGIVALLASIAIPQFQSMQFRSRQAERQVVITSVHRAINEYYLREGRYPHEVGGVTRLILGRNPDSDPGGVRRAFKSQGSPSDDWKSLTVLIEGGVFYSYRAEALTAGNAQRTHWIQAQGDLDADGVLDDLTKSYTYTSDVLVRVVGGPGDCTSETYLPLDRSFEVF